MAVIRVTLDRNALLNLERGDGDTAGLRRLVELHSNGVIMLCVPAILASERQRDGTRLDTYAKFQSFLASLGLRDYEEFKPPLYIGMAYVGHCVIHGAEMERVEQQIHEILFPNLEFKYADYVARLGSRVTTRLRQKWRNAKCDVLAIWSHIHYGADIFVTEDRNFHKVTKKPRLLALGAGRICRPSECVELAEDAARDERPTP
jgi:hypothetical protein